MQQKSTVPHRITKESSGADCGSAGLKFPRRDAPNYEIISPHLCESIYSEGSPPYHRAIPGAFSCTPQKTASPLAPRQVAYLRTAEKIYILYAGDTESKRSMLIKVAWFTRNCISDHNFRRAFGCASDDKLGTSGLARFGLEAGRCPEDISQILGFCLLRSCLSLRLHSFDRFKLEVFFFLIEEVYI